MPSALSRPAHDSRSRRSLPVVAASSTTSLLRFVALAALASLAALAGACNKSYRFGGSSSGAPDSQGATFQSSHSSQTSGESDVPGASPYPDAPADPWLAVDGNRPRRLSAARARDIAVRLDRFPCTAAHDHCLLAETWFYEADERRDRDLVHRTALPTLVGPEGLMKPRNTPGYDLGAPDGPYTLYRSVPATRQNVRKGSLVLALTFPNPHPTSGIDVHHATWLLGTVDRIAWPSGKLYFTGITAPVWLSSARVVVLQWRPDRGLELRGGAAREALAVARRDVILPALQTAAADPWAEVGDDRQPKLPLDEDPLTSGKTHRCDADADHCLRPWVWFVALGDRAVPARFTSKGFADALERPIANAGYAYRTAPATAETLRPGVLVVYSRQAFDDEVDAFVTVWRLGKVVALDGAAGLFKVAGSTEWAPIGMARIAVLQWFLGEAAKAVRAPPLR